MIIHVFNGTGIDKAPLSGFLRANFPGGKIYPLTAKEIKAGALRGSYASEEPPLLVLPGAYGAHHYTNLLQPTHAGELNGLQEIRQFVHDGGNVIGFCAGACLVGHHVCWDGNKKLSSDRGQTLGLLDVTSVGPLPEVVGYREVFDSSGNPHTFFNLGGSYFRKNPGADQVAFLGSYEKGSENFGAVVSGRYGKGRVLAWQPHPEYTTESLEKMHKAFKAAGVADNGYVTTDDSTYAAIARGLEIFFANFEPRKISQGLFGRTVKQAFGPEPLKQTSALAGITGNIRAPRSLSPTLEAIRLQIDRARWFQEGIS
jgi:glutamine amidotransferase-like uncharacterized protein